MEKVKDYLRMFRAQTMPATLFLILVPYLTNGTLISLETLEVALFAVLAHYLSFGHNSLMDTYGGWDLKDPSKASHPLVAGRISMTAAHNVIHWGLALLAILGCIITFQLSPTPVIALLCLLMWFVWGHSYNDGLDKESLFSFVPISLCFTFMGMYGWFLSHGSLNMTGWLYIGYVFFLILFQISYEGCLKELEIRERSNILVKFGAEVRVVGGIKRFIPGRSGNYGVVTKGLNVFFGLLLLLWNFNQVRLVAFVILSALIFTLLHQLVKPRLYIRDKELLSMSIMEILSIYLAPWLMLDPLTVIILEVIGIFYFFGINLWLWKMPAPKV